MDNTRSQRLDEARRLLQCARLASSNYRYEKRRRGEETNHNPPIVMTTSVFSCIFAIGQKIAAELSKVIRQQQTTEHRNVLALPSSFWTPKLRVILCGTRNEQSTLSCLRGCEDTLVKHIYSYLIDWTKPCVICTKPAQLAGRFYDWGRDRVDMERDGEEFEFVMHPSYPPVGSAPAVNVLIDYGGNTTTMLGPKRANRPEIAFTTCGSVDFPSPQDVNVNMLPFVMGDPESLPAHLRQYYLTVIARCPVEESEIGKVVYLTVTESFVKAGNSQRRGGLHIEAPGSFATEASFAAALEHHWGVGIAFSPDELHGGIYMASNVNRTCKVWNALVTQTGAVDSHGGMEYLRHLIGGGYEMAANELVWMTDKTPHEALPQEKDAYRQFFRLVTSDISVWFADHSTPNPNVPLPDYVRVVEGSKFA